MNILDSLQNNSALSHTEKEVAKYILNHKTDVLSMSVQELSKATFTSPSIVLRLCKKIGLKGFPDFKIKFAAELQKLDEPFISSIDPDFPLNARDSFFEFSKKIYQLSKEALDDTYKKLSITKFEQAVQILKSKNRIGVFALGDSYVRAMAFQNKMMKINKQVYLTKIPMEDLHFAKTLTKDDCSIFVSYSGTTPHLLQIAQILKKNHVPIITITSNPDSHLARMSDVVLETTNKEGASVKYSTFVSSIGIDFILNNIYSYFFVDNYESNSKRRRETEMEFANKRS